MRRAALCACASLAVVTAPARALGDEPVGIELDCPALGADQQAALEARLRATMAVNRAQGNLVVRCQPDGITSTWTATGGPPVSLRAAAPAAVTALPEAILELADQSSRPRATATTPGDGSPGAQAPPAPTSGARRSVPPAALPEGPRHSLGVSVGAVGDLWWGSPAAVLGPRGSVDLAIGSLAVELGGGVRWALDPPRDLAVRLVQFHAAIDGVLGDGRHVGIGGGLEGSLVTFASESLTPSSQAGSAVAVFARARWLVHAGVLRLGIGPELRYWLRSSVVDIERVEVLRIPLVTAGIGVDVRALVAGW